MATVGVTFRMDVVQYVRMTQLVSQENAGLRATDSTISHFIRQALGDAMSAADEELAKSAASKKGGK